MGLARSNDLKSMMINGRIITLAILLLVAIRALMVFIFQDVTLIWKLPLKIPEDFPFAHKMGDLDGVEHDAGLLFFQDRTVLVVVMTKDLRRNYDGIRLCNDIGGMVYEHYI